MIPKNYYSEDSVAVIKPNVPYMITPHLRQFTLKDKPTPCIYDDVSRTYMRLVTWGTEEGVAYKATVISEGWKPLIKIHVYKGPLETAMRIIEHILNVKYVYPDTSLLIRTCPGLREVVERYPGLRPALNPSMWESLVKTIVNQQILVHLALRIISKLVEYLGKKINIDKSRIFYDFPTPEAILNTGIDVLRNMGLSKRKAEYVTDIAKAIVKQGYDLERIGKLTPQEAIEELMTFRGIGPWTAKLAYMAYTGNLNLLLPEDLSVNRGFRLANCRREFMIKAVDYAGLISYLTAILYEHISHN